MPSSTEAKKFSGRRRAEAGCSPLFTIGVGSGVGLDVEPPPPHLHREAGTRCCRVRMCRKVVACSIPPP